jgi:hypothetical protein
MTPPDPSGRRKQLLAAFRMPAVQTMVSRKSSITNAFVNALIPVIPPSPDEIEQALTILGMDVADVRCVYCGNPSSEWDHLRPLVVKARPTGYISEIANLVPACGKCNQSKGNTAWWIWIASETAPHSPTTRRIADVSDRIARLEAYEQWREPTKIDFETTLGTDSWTKYWSMWEAINVEMRKCQQFADTLRDRVKQSIRPK